MPLVNEKFVSVLIGSGRLAPLLGQALLNGAATPEGLLQMGSIGPDDYALLAGSAPAGAAGLAAVGAGQNASGSPSAPAALPPIPVAVASMPIITGSVAITSLPANQPVTVPGGIAVTSSAGTSDQVSGTVALSASNAVASVGTTGLAGASVSFVGGGTLVATLVAEVSADAGNTWQPSYFSNPSLVPVLGIPSGGVSTALGVSSPGGGLLGVGLLPGTSQARVRVLSYVSGSSSVSLRASAAGPVGGMSVPAPGLGAPPPVAVLASAAALGAGGLAVSQPTQAALAVKPGMWSAQGLASSQNQDTAQQAAGPGKYLVVDAILVTLAAGAQVQAPISWQLVHDKNGTPQVLLSGVLAAPAYGSAKVALTGLNLPQGVANKSLDLLTSGTVAQTTLIGCSLSGYVAA